MISQSIIDWRVIYLMENKMISEQQLMNPRASHINDGDISLS